MKIHTIEYDELLNMMQTVKRMNQIHLSWLEDACDMLLNGKQKNQNAEACEIKVAFIDLKNNQPVYICKI